MIRDEAIAAAYRSAADRMPGVSLESFAQSLDGWTVHPITLGGMTVGAVLVCGNELHACVLPEAHGRWFNKRTAAILAGVIKEHGMAVTRASTSAGRAFVKRLGFVEVGDLFVKEH